MAKKVKKLEEVKPIEEEVVETPIEESNDVLEDREVVECGLEETPVEEIKEETTEAPTELPKVEFNEEIAPKGYSSVIPHVEDKNPLKMKDGRIYQEVGNGLGMFLDNGSVFKL